ncbi:MAG TPA: flagellar motor protein MotD [Steroidobacteraceae bacterium]|nr:flagellar motor protein MotD [Steroidobacteraceae bacterium]
MPRKKPHVEELNHEAWAIPYGDLVTLLLAFFVVMYAMSSLNEGKYRVLSDALNAEFRGPPRSPEPVQIGAQQRGDGSSEVVLLASDAKQIQPSPVVRETTLEVPRAVTPTEEMSGDLAQLKDVAGKIGAAMSKLIDERMVTIRNRGLWVEVDIQTDILFPSGIATLSPLAISVLQPLADALKSFPNPVRVEGHTDNVPIKRREFPSNWELSAARAASVVHLFAERGVPPGRLTVIGLGEFRPMKSNDNAEGRSANRRVVLVILGQDGLPAGTYGSESDKVRGN